jgi:hypothetical protein
VRGRGGGRPGVRGVLTLRSGRPIRPKGRQTVPVGDAICLALPGGGGFGDPRARDPQRVLDDVLDGMITAEEARRDYGVAILRSRNSTCRDGAPEDSRLSRDAVARVCSAPRSDLRSIGIVHRRPWHAAPSSRTRPYRASALAPHHRGFDMNSLSIGRRLVIDHQGSELRPRFGPFAGRVDPFGFRPGCPSWRFA